MFRVHFAKLRGPYQSSRKELVKCNMQDITAMECITTHKKMREIGRVLEKIDIFPAISLYFNPSCSRFGHSLPTKFMFLE